MDSDWLSVFLSFFNWTKNHSESDSSDIALLCGYCFSSDVNFTIFIESERLLKLYKAIIIILGVNDPLGWVEKTFFTMLVNLNDPLFLPSSWWERVTFLYFSVNT